ncbi:MAG TPA: DUF305 domain-containing protein [Opitutaceae bacterium]|nr:DUF305 domain-containing protein [Opitutaceae bacterium]
MLRKVLTPFVATMIMSTALYASAPAPNKDQAQFEVRFLTMMIDHHYGAVKMAELCAGRTVHPELQQTCDNIESSQTQEIATMRSWLQSWYGTDHAPTLTPKMQRQVDQLSKLTGTEFEQQFMLMMIPHHANAIIMATDALLRAYHPDLLNMAAKMAGSQADEIAQMRLWLCRWYLICDLKQAGTDRAGHHDD